MFKFFLNIFLTSFFKLNSINQSRFIYVSILIIVAFCSLDRLVTVFKPFNFLFKNKLKFQLPVLSVTLIIIMSFVIPGTYFNVQEIVIIKQLVHSQTNLNICGCLAIFKNK